MRQMCVGVVLLWISAAAAQTPVMSWNFETLKDGKALESSTNIEDAIEGSFEQAAGVKGKGLRVDGFTTRVVREGKNIVKPGEAFTLEAWVALGEYPENWCPVLTTESSEVKGYRLQIGPYGQVSFETAISEQWAVCSSANETMPLRKWMHLVGVYTAGEAMTLHDDRFDSGQFKGKPRLDA